MNFSILNILLKMMHSALQNFYVSGFAKVSIHFYCWSRYYKPGFNEYKLKKIKHNLKLHLIFFW